MRCVTFFLNLRCDFEEKSNYFRLLFRIIIHLLFQTLKNTVTRNVSYYMIDVKMDSSKTMIIALKKI